MIISCNTIVDRRDHVQYLTVSKSYSYVTFWPISVAIFRVLEHNHDNLIRKSKDMFPRFKAQFNTMKMMLQYYAIIPSY